jgi:hypothetical protein
VCMRCISNRLVGAVVSFTVAVPYRNELRHSD